MTKASIDKAISNLKELVVQLEDFGELEEQRAKVKAEVAETGKTLASMTKQLADVKVEFDRISQLTAAKGQELMAIQNEITAKNNVLGPLTTKLADIKARIFSQ